MGFFSRFERDQKDACGLILATIRQILLTSSKMKEKIKAITKMCPHNRTLSHSYQLFIQTRQW